MPTDTTSQPNAGTTAPVITSNVPERISYAGRNYIAFTKIAGIPISFKQAISLPPTGTSAPSSGSVPAPAAPTPVAVRPVQPAAIVALPADGGGDGGGTEVYVDINSPRNGATLTGPSDGITLNVLGDAGILQGSGYVKEVTVQIGSSNPFKPASLDASGNWSFTDKMTTPGWTRITAGAKDNTGKHSAQTWIMVNIVLSNPAGGDTTPPMVNITQPANGALQYTNTSTVTVNVQGTASDPDGSVQIVEVTLDNNEANYIAATPKAPNDWSTWTAAIANVSTGNHTITARGKDKANNVTKVTVSIAVSPEPPKVIRLNRLLLIESYRLSSYLGNYGPGRTLKTFTLLPGETTKISVKTYTKTTTDAQSASSILDSFSQTSSDDFQNSVQNEASDKQGFTESMNYDIKAHVDAQWGWGSADLSGELSGSTNSTREDFAKNVSSATHKHAATASAKRDVQINTSYEVSTETGEETSIEREITNINVSRTLNFVFRQMNQEFITVLHLVDARVGFYREEVDVNQQVTYTYREVTIPQLGSLLDAVIDDSSGQKEQAIYGITSLLTSIFDYQDQQQSLIELKQFNDTAGNPIVGANYWRVKRNLTSTYKDPVTGTEFVVPGIIVSADKNVLRTEGIIVDALLGEGDALDAYSHGLQDEAVKAQQLANAQTQADIDKNESAVSIIKNKDDAAAKVFAQVYPCCPKEELALLLAQLQGKADGSGTPAKGGGNG